MTPSEHVDSLYAGSDSPAMELDQVYFDQAAIVIAGGLQQHGFAHVVLEPDDGTRYEIAVVERIGTLHGARYAVASSLAALYPWNGSPTIHPDYAAEHYSGDHNRWTGVVMARLLNTTALIMAAQE